MPKRKILKKIPRFSSEAQERAFWEEHDTADYVDWSSTHQQQTGIIRLLRERGANPADKDGRGKQVIQAVTSEWIRTLLIGGSG